MLRELQRALSDAISESPDVHQTVRRIQDEGYALYLLLDCKREMPSLTEVPLESSRLSVGEPVFQIDTRDLSFLRSIGIDPTRRLRRRRPSRAL